MQAQAQGCFSWDGRRNAFFAFSKPSRTANKALSFFSKEHDIPIVMEASDLGAFDTVFFSLHSFRDFYDLARLFKYKPRGQEWIAGGNAATNPTAIMGICDYVFIGDAFLAFAGLAAGNRQMPGLLSCKHPTKTRFNEEPICPRQYTNTEILMSVGCKRRCYFCVNAWRRGYQEQDPCVIEEFIKNAGTKGVSLTSNSSSDVSYYERVDGLLLESEMLDLTISSSIYNIDERFATNHRREMLVGIEGMSERLRRVVNKPIGRATLVERASMVLRLGRQLRTVYQFNLPGETEDDWREFIEDITAIAAGVDHGSWAIPFIPHLPTAFTPSQWLGARYSTDMARRIMDLRNSFMGKAGIKTYIPAPLYPKRWFSQVVAEWVPLTDEVVRVVEGLSEKATLDDYIAKLEGLGCNIAVAFQEHPADFRFPWDDLVEVATSKETLWKHYQKMQRRLGDDGRQVEDPVD